MDKGRPDRVRVAKPCPWWTWLGIVLVTAGLTALGARGTVRMVDWTRGGTRYEVWAEQARVGFVISDAAMQRGVWGGLGHATGVRIGPERAKASIQSGATSQRMDGLLVPVWCFGALVLGVVTLVWWRRPMRVAPGACVVCGYALEGIGSGVCPECGAGVSRG